MRIHHLLFYFLIITTFANQVGYMTSRINPASNSLCTSAFAAATFSFDILWSFCFLGLAEGVHLKLVLNYVSANSHEVGGLPHENIIIFV
jgi:hypothetical protein